jgi:hypothetical protein
MKRILHPALVAFAAAAVILLAELIMRSRYQIDVKSKVIDVHLKPASSADK